MSLSESNWAFLSIIGLLCSLRGNFEHWGEVDVGLVEMRLERTVFQAEKARAGEGAG